MLIIAVSADTQKRKMAINKMIGTVASADILFFDDSHMTLTDLEQYLYPSLFSLTTPVISGLFLLDAQRTDLDSIYITKLVQSPTLFILEEHTLSTPHKKILTKAGAQIILEDEKKAAVKKISPLFAAVTVICTSSDRKEKWLTLQKTLETESAEALVGMLYWKLRDLLQKDVRKKEVYKKKYQGLIRAHATAWMENVPLGLMLEKIVLQK